MSEFSGRLQYDDRQSEEDEAVADSCTFLAYRRLAASRGKAHRVCVATNWRARCASAEDVVEICFVLVTSYWAH